MTVVRNIFGFRNTKIVSAKKCHYRAAKLGNICVRNNVYAIIGFFVSLNENSKKGGIKNEVKERRRDGRKKQRLGDLNPFSLRYTYRQILALHV